MDEEKRGWIAAGWSNMNFPSLPTDTQIPAPKILPYPFLKKLTLLIHSLTHSLTHPFIHPLLLTHLPPTPTHPSIHPSIHPSTHALIHSVSHLGLNGSVGGFHRAAHFTEEWDDKKLEGDHGRHWVARQSKEELLPAPVHEGGKGGGFPGGWVVMCV